MADAEVIPFGDVMADVDASEDAVLKHLRTVVNRWPAIVKPGDVAALLDVTERTVRRWVDGGKLGGLKLPGAYRIPRAAVDVYLVDCYTGQGGRSP